MVELHRIHGPPGCGKTTKIAAWARRACEVFGPDAVALCSMTKTAAHEIRSRGLPVPSDQVGTLHALCYRALGRPPLYLEHIEDWNQRHPRYSLSSSVPGVDEEQPDGPRGNGAGDDLDARLGLLRARMTPERLWPSDVRAFAKAWGAWKEELGVLDFHDLIADALAANVPPPGGARVLFADEAQDLSAVEHALLRQWAPQTEYTVICGDADQSLYGWRGGDPEVFLDPLPAGPGAEHPLTQSYRVPEAARAYAAKWIGQCSQRFPVDYHARVDEHGAVVNGALARTQTTLKQVEIVDLVMAELQRVEGQVMLLASCSYLLAPALAKLKANGIPFACPYRTRNGSWNPMRGAVDRLAALLAPALSPGWEEPTLWTAPELWAFLEHARADRTMARGLKGVLKSRAAEEKGKRWKGKEVEAKPLTLDEVRGYMLPDALASLLDVVNAPRDQVYARACAWIDGHLTPAHRKRWDYALAILRRNGTAGLFNEPRVVVGTCHAVKGGEADSVILSPDASPAAARAWAQGGRGRDDVRRTFYVGMTRTRDRLTILGSASGYPGAIPI